MKIYRPIKANYKTQGFGEATVCAKSNQYGGAALPIKISGKVGGLCMPGYVDFYTRILGMKGHNGEDWAANFKEPIYFPVEADTGWYARTEIDRDGGIGIDVFSKKRIFIDELPPQTGKKARKEWETHDKMMYVKFRFWHNHSNLKTAKQPVAFAEKIALADSTGASGGDHLHWCMKFVDKDDKTLDEDNGYRGAVDYSRWYKNIYVLDAIETVKTVAAVVTEVAKLPEPEQQRPLSLIQLLLEALAKLFK